MKRHYMVNVFKRSDARTLLQAVMVDAFNKDEAVRLAAELVESGRVAWDEDRYLDDAEHDLTPQIWGFVDCQGNKIYV